MLGDPQTWVTVSFLIFVGVMIYMKVPAKVAAMLDERSARIAKELAEAKKLREEAQALLDEYKKKRVQAEKDAEDIVALARKEAEAYAHETRAKLTETLERRTRQAEQKIAQAEQQAVKDVRTAATDVAISAATELLGVAAEGAKGARLIEESIDAVKSRLN
ncbi:MAG: ATP F0F1 synthase subunit B [Parvibaculaceae bacterium]